MISKHSLTVSLASGLIALAACGSDDTPTQTVEPDPPVIAISELRPRGADVWRVGDPEPLLVGCDRRLGVSVELTNFILRPRNACGGVSECGYLHATLTGPDGASSTVDSAIDSFVFDFTSFEAFPTDPVSIRVALHSDSGMPSLTPEGDAIATELVLLLAADDCEGGAAGAGGEAGSGASGAAGAEGGAAGEPGGAAGLGGEGGAGLGGEGGAGGGDAGHAGAETAGAGGITGEGASGSGGDAVVSGAGGA